MKLQSMICPKCGGQLYFEEEQDTCFCSHCGTQVFKEENGKRSFTFRTIDDAKIKTSEAERDIKLKELEYQEQNHSKRNRTLLNKG